jgi:hypothetical protein
MPSGIPENVKRATVGISPIIPTVAGLLLAALWGLTVFAGWGLAAFCTGGESTRDCAARLDTVFLFSGLFALAAACCTAAAHLAPWVRREPARFALLMSAAVIAWLVANGVLFVGGMIAR